MHDIAKKYSGQYKSIGAILAITSALRPQTVGTAGDKAKFEYQALVGTILTSMRIKILLPNTL